MVVKIKYPEIDPWRTDIRDEERLEIINIDDFPREVVLKNLGISGFSLVRSFGLSNVAASEIQERLALGKFLSENPNFVKVLKGMGRSSIPTDYQSFVNYYDRPDNGHVRHWENVCRFLRTLSEYKNLIPSRIRVIQKVLEASLPLEKDEVAMAKIIQEEVEKIAVIEGVVEFRMSWDRYNDLELCYTSGKVHGHQRFSAALNPQRLKKYPTWIDKWWAFPLGWFGIIRRVKKKIDAQNREYLDSVYRPMVIDRPSTQLIDDILRGLKSKLGGIDWCKIRQQDICSVKHAALKVFFSYSKPGLFLRIYDIGNLSDFHVELPEFKFGHFRGYSAEMQKGVKQIRAQILEEVRKIAASRAENAFRDLLREQRPDFFDETFKVESTATDRHHKWFAMETFLNEVDLRATYEAAQENRKFFYEKIGNICEVVNLLETVRSNAVKLTKNLCFPNILSNGEHILSFEEIHPIHLMGQVEKIVPIRHVPNINSQMVGITGRHGGGKTTICETIMVYIWLAQSGIPLPGISFSLNPKKKIGMVFLGRGKGSTCQTMVRKTKNLLEAIQDVEGKNVVLVIDEVGTGTQESAGYDFGWSLLKTFAQSGVSSVFSTQITRLAENVRDELDALIFQVDDKHNVNPGVGGGGLPDVIKQEGLDKLLVHD